MMAGAVASLVGLANAAVFAIVLDVNHAPQFMWGFWGILGADLGTLGLLAYNQPMEKR